MASPGSHCLHGAMQEKLSPAYTTDLGRWALIPVEFSSCTNKAEWITKGLQGRGREKRRMSPESEHLHMYLLQDLHRTSWENEQKFTKPQHHHTD